MRYDNIGFKIDYCTSGFFTANDTPMYWRTVHAANILQNWAKVCELAEKYTKLHDEMTKEIFRVNAPEKKVYIFTETKHIDIIHHANAARNH